MHKLFVRSSTAAPVYLSETRDRAERAADRAARGGAASLHGMRPTPAEVDDMLFDTHWSSLRGYFADQSGGQAEIQRVGVLGWFDAIKPADHYWNHPRRANDGFSGDGAGHTEKWWEVITAADAQVDYSSFDDNGDKILTPDELGILIVIPQAIPFGTNRPVVGPRKRPLVVDGVTLTSIAEVYIPSVRQEAAGVIRHEVAHLLFDLPDLYGNTRYPNHAAGDYSLMDVTHTDAQIDAPLRLKRGWVTARDIGPGVQDLTGLRSVRTSREVIRFLRKGGRYVEYFLFEIRTADLFDRQLPENGLVIWRVRETGNVQDQVRIKPHGREAWSGLRDMPPLALKWADGTDSGLTVTIRQWLIDL